MLKNFYYKLLRLPKVIKGKDVFFPIQYRCNIIRIGNKGASWSFCPDKINNNSIIYSFGVGTDISFDEQIIQKFSAKVYAFDPTPKSIDWLKKQSLPQNFFFMPIGLAAYDGEAIFNLPNNDNYVSGSIFENQENNKNKIIVNVKRLQTIMQMLKHEHIDILKLDIEGAEYKAIDDILQSNIDISQILMEIHHRFDNFNVSDTINLFNKLNTAGYKIFYISPTGEEYSFIKI
jgi:FkbM family methyltransferase